MNNLSNPTPNANYLLDPYSNDNECIMFGWYPTPNNDGMLSNSIHALLSTGRNTFVNLVSMEERSSLFDYTSIVMRHVSNPIFIYYEIPDQRLPSDLNSYRELIQHLHTLVNEGRRIYIHCRGGHGRSGIVAACLLIHMGYSSEEALVLVSNAHKTREYIPDYPCPQTADQVEFVRNYRC
jgi:protein-tyrosine phosphatase